MKDFNPKAEGDARQVNFAGGNHGNVFLPSPRSPRRDFVAIAASVVAVLGVAATMVFGLARLARGSESAAIVTNNFGDQIINMAPPTSDASAPNNSGRACSETVDGSPSGWGPARILLPEKDLLPWPGFNQDNLWHYGDERNFYSGRASSAAAEADATIWTGVGDQTSKIRVERGKFYILMIYVHNSGGDADSRIALDTRVSVSLPTCTGRQVHSNAFVDSDNAQPSTIWDGVTFYSDERFNLAYVAGSARLCNNHFTCKDDGSTLGVPLSDDIMTKNGALIGYDKLDGKFRGNYRYSAYVYILVRPQFAPE